jgi:DNA polymerase-1
LDTHSLLTRAFFAMPPMTTSAGQPTAALFGLSAMLLKVLREDRPLGLAFALDCPEPSFRQTRSPSFKSERPTLAEPLREQLSMLPRLLRAFAVPCYGVPTYEADDVVATLARQLENDGHVSRVVTGDRDLFQIVRERVDVMFVGARGQPPVVYDRAAIERRFGLTPEQLPSLTALIGDDADQLPKVKGVGERGAGALVRSFGNARNLLAQVSKVTPARLRESIERSADQIIATEALAKLRDDVPLPSGPRYGAVGPAALLHVRELFLELEFKSLLPRIDALLSSMP